MPTTSFPHRFPHLALMCPIGLFVFFGLFLGGATAGSHSTAVLFAGAVTSPQATPPPSTAILFLVDESGGVSGECSRKSEKDVLVVDQDGRRYDVIRFYYQLLRAYSKFLTAENQSNSLPEVWLGASTFAKDYQLTRPPQKLSDLAAMDKTLWKKEVWDRLVPRVDSVADWHCKTNYPEALKKAAEALKDTGAERQVLVLLTDGMVIGDSELQGANVTEQQKAKTDKDRTSVRTDVVDAIKKIREQAPLSVMVVLLGNELCNGDNSRDCGSLSDDTKKWRREDLDRWTGDELKKEIILVDNRSVFRDLSEFPDPGADDVRPPTWIGDLLPRITGYSSGWIESNSNTILEVTGDSSVVKYNIVTRENTDASQVKIAQLPDNANPEAFSETRDRPWPHSSYTLKPHGIQDTCPGTQLQVTVPDDGLPAFAWWTIESKYRPELGEPKITPGGQIVINDTENLTVDVPVKLYIDDYASPRDCYRVRVELVASGEDALPAPSYSPTPDLKLLPHDSGAVRFQVQLYDALPVATAKVRAILTNHSGTPVPCEDTCETSMEVGLTYRPEFPNGETFEILSSAVRGLNTPVPLPLTVRYDGKLRAVKPTPDATFELYPHIPGQEDGTPTPLPDACKKVSGTDGIRVDYTVKPSELTLWASDYELQLPYDGALESACGFRTLRIAWTAPDGTSYVAWNQINVLPTPTPKPTSTPPCPSGVRVLTCWPPEFTLPLFWALLVACIVGLAMVVRLLRLRS